MLKKKITKEKSFSKMKKAAESAENSIIKKPKRVRSKKALSSEEKPKEKATPTKSKLKLVAGSKQEKLFTNLLKVTLSFIKGKQYSPLTKELLIQRLQIHPAHLEIFDAVLSTLHTENQVQLVNDMYTQIETDQFRLSTGEERTRGSLSVHPRGFGFVSIPSESQDVFIPKPYMNGALDGDIVDIAIDTLSTSGKGPEGRVLRIIERKRTQLIGIVTEVVGKTIHLYSNLLAEHHEIQTVTAEKPPLMPGDRIVLDVHTWGGKEKPTICSVAERIGHIRDPKNDLQYAIRASGLQVEFPKNVVEEAKQFGSKVTVKDMKGREDFRSLECFTIDPDTAKDFDDALSLEKTKFGYSLGVHIADVSHYVKEGSALDDEAKKRCNSTYFPNYCIPMLPRELSECLCSLRPNVNRLTVSVFFEIDENGTTQSWKIVRGVIKSKKRFTYREVKEILDKRVKSPFLKKLQLMESLCRLLQQKRHERGSVQLFLPELIVRVSDTGEPTGTDIIQYDVTHQIVEEFMLKANEIVAIELSRRGKDLSYRVHDEPSAESLRDFATLVSAFGYELPSTPTPQDIQKFFLEIEGASHAPFLSVCYIRSMRLACYSPDNIGHYGLSLEHYCHFTSPIRRYVDTIVHRLLFEKGPTRDEIEIICKEASEKERQSARAEGSLITTKKLRLLSSWLKKDKGRVFEAVITRVKPFGIFFDITDLMLEGFLHVSELEDDYYIFDEDASRLVGRYEGITYASGEKVHVSCRHVDLLIMEASWVFVDRQEESPQAKTKVKNKKSKNILKNKERSR